MYLSYERNNNNLLSSHLLSGKALKYTKILPPVLYRWETQSVTLRKESRLKVSESGVPREIFGTKEIKVRE
jgi:hypothetical protein